MKHVPKYLIPNLATAAAAAVTGAGNTDGAATFVPFSKGRGRGRGRGGKFSGGRGGVRGGKKKKQDPLKNFR